MQVSNQITIHADYERIFELAARVEDWGRLLPHYRYVRVLRRDGNRKWVRMSALRNFIPVTWTAIQTVYPGTMHEPGHITFHHTGGLVRGMDVQWRFSPRDDGSVVVTIAHHLHHPPLPVRLLGAKLMGAIVGRTFISYIAGKTLRRIKQLAEQAATPATQK